MSTSGIQPEGNFDKYFDFDKKPEGRKEDAPFLKQKLDHLVASRLARHQEIDIDKTIRGTASPKAPAGIRYAAEILAPIGQQEVEKGIESHRNPLPGGKTVEAFMKEEGADKAPSHWLTDMRDRRVKPELEAFKAAGHSEKEVKYEEARLKEKHNEKIYKEKFNENVDSGLYKPKSMAEEMHKVLKCSDKMPISINSMDELLALLAEEIDNYRNPGGTVPCLTEKVIPLLTEQLASIIELYKQEYPEKSNLELFELSRDLVRVAAYQEHFDRSVFTGSDHGVLHIHHNCKNGNDMHEKLAKYEEDNPKAALLSKIVHFYHDIGYSVGAAAGSFAVMKDHPFIGAAFIRANESYFHRLLGVEETTVLERSILNHAIVSFDAKENDINNMYKLVRFTTSNSDACAVAGDQKAQRFWRDNPQSIKEILRLGQFLSIHPDCAKPLGSELIMKSPQKAISAWLKNPALSTNVEVEVWLKNPTLDTMPKVFDEANFKNSTYCIAFKTFVAVRSNLLILAKRVELPLLEREAFEQAILNNFNRMGAEIVLKQFGAELIQTSIERNSDDEIAKGENKYRPEITIGPARFFPALVETVGRAMGGGNITKVLMDEYAAEKESLENALRTAAEAPVGSTTRIEANSKVAKIYVVMQQRMDKITDMQKQYKEVLSDLDAVGQNTVPYATRSVLNEFIYAITPKENKSKPNEPPKDERGNLLTLIGNKYYLSERRTKASENMNNLLNEDLSAFIPQDKLDDLFQRLTIINSNLRQNTLKDLSIEEIFELQALLVNEKDLDFISKGTVEHLPSAGDVSGLPTPKTPGPAHPPTPPDEPDEPLVIKIFDDQ